jgi:hypothetical protein
MGRVPGRAKHGEIPTKGATDRLQGFWWGGCAEMPMKTTARTTAVSDSPGHPRYRVGGGKYGDLSVANVAGADCPRDMRRVISSSVVPWGNASPVVIFTRSR